MKKKTLRKTLAFLMTATMAVSATGCGGSGGDSKEEKSRQKLQKTRTGKGLRKQQT